MERRTGSREGASGGRTTLERWGRSRTVAEVELVVLTVFPNQLGEGGFLAPAELLSQGR